MRASFNAALDAFVHQQNLSYLRTQLANVQDDARRLQLARLLAEEESKEQGLLKQKYIDDIVYMTR